MLYADDNKVYVSDFVTSRVTPGHFKNHESVGAVTCESVNNIERGTRCEDFSKTMKEPEMLSAGCKW